MSNAKVAATIVDAAREYTLANPAGSRFDARPHPRTCVGCSIVVPAYTAFLTLDVAPRAAYCMACCIGWGSVRPVLTPAPTGHAPADAPAPDFAPVFEPDHHEYRVYWTADRDKGADHAAMTVWCDSPQTALVVALDYFTEYQQYPAYLPLEPADSIIRKGYAAHGASLYTDGRPENRPAAQWWVCGPFVARHGDWNV